MTSSGRYDTAGYPEDQYEPGSDGMVLKNLRGISSCEEMAIVEMEYLWKAQDHLLEVIEEDQLSAVRAGLDRNYAPMKQLFLDVIRRSEETIAED